MLKPECDGSGWAGASGQLSFRAACEPINITHLALASFCVNHGRMQVGMRQISAVMGSLAPAIIRNPDGATRNACAREACAHHHCGHGQKTLISVLPNRMMRC